LTLRLFSFNSKIYLRLIIQLFDKSLRILDIIQGLIMILVKMGVSIILIESLCIVLVLVLVFIEGHVRLVLPVRIWRAARRTLSATF
jgi:hypothetical protein